MKMWEYKGKHIRVRDIDGKVSTGYYDHYVSALDSPDGVETLSIRPDSGERILIEFEESEIADIEIIDADIHEMAKVV